MKGTIIKAGKKFSSHQFSADKAPRVIALTSGKGGVGKTNVTVNLGIGLAKLGSRVILFDADLGLANVEVVLGLAPRYTLYDFLYRGKTLRDILLPGPNNIKIISGGSGLLELANLNNQDIIRLRDAVKEFQNDVDYVLVDTGAGLNKNVLAFVAAAQEVVVVVTPEPTSVTDAYGLIKVLAKFNTHSEVKIIINRVQKKQEAEETFRKLQVTAQHFLPNISIKRLGAIPEDAAVVKAVKKQQPFITLYPDSAAGAAVRESAAKLAGVSADKGTGLLGFFSRLTRLFV